MISTFLQTLVVCTNTDVIHTLPLQTLSAFFIIQTELKRYCFFICAVCVCVFRELAELHKSNATKASEAQELALCREVQAKEELSLALDKAQEEARLQQEALANQVTRGNYCISDQLLIIIIRAGEKRGGQGLLSPK